MAKGGQSGPAHREGHQPPPQQPQIGPQTADAYELVTFLNQNFLVNQRKMLKHICCKLMIG